MRTVEIVNKESRVHFDLQIPSFSCGEGELSKYFLYVIIDVPGNAREMM